MALRRLTCRRAFLFQRSRIMRNAAQKAFACLSSERGRVERVWPSLAFSKDKIAFAKERRRTKPFRGPKEHLFCSPQSARFSRQKGPAAHQAPQGRIACRRQNMAQPCRTASPTRIWERTAAQYAPHTTEDADAAAHGFPPAAVYAVHNKRSAPPTGLPAAYGLSGPRAASAAFPSDTAAFRLFPPSDAPLARGNGCHSARPRQQPSVRRMPSMQAFGPAGALWPLPNPRLEHRPQLVRNPAFFSAAEKADAPLFYAR